MIALLALAMAAEPDWVEALRTSDLSDEQIDAIQQITAKSKLLGTGLPGPTRHPMTPETCRERRAAAGLPTTPPDNACGRAWMVPLPDGKGCIDQFEFPGVPCAYPVIWVRAAEAAAVCEAAGKRLCDASEWEDACAGTAAAPDDLSIAAGKSVSAAHALLRETHNKTAEQGWAYGDTYQTGVCAAASTKSPACDGSSPSACGSNTYPTGSFVTCHSANGVYDQHGNAAEHMNLPLTDSQRKNGTGVTEMKGSWFIWDTTRAHPDWCRWRAPYWHGGPVRDANSHRNYHLGFRCCADLEPP